MQYNAFTVADFLINKKILHIRSLVSRKLNDFADFVVILYGTVTAKILFESLANSLDIQIIRQSCYGRDTLSSVSLLNTNMDLFFGIASGIVSGVFESVCSIRRVRCKLPVHFLARKEYFETYRKY
jgi:hypothetical protein